jgi:hypothetical protein
LGVMGCNNVELSCAPRQIVLLSSWLVTAWRGVGLPCQNFLIISLRLHLLLTSYFTKREVLLPWFFKGATHTGCFNVHQRYRENGTFSLVVSADALCLLGPGFDSWFGNRLLWLRFFVVVNGSSGNFQEYYFKRDL